MQVNLRKDHAHAFHTPAANRASEREGERGMERGREGERDVGTISGLNVLRIVNEPTAAAIAYGRWRENDRERERGREGERERGREIRALVNKQGA